jgi:hypothetical protein
LVLAKHERAPETWQAPLMAELAETGADGDRDLIAAAQALLDLVGDVGDGQESTRSMSAGRRACRSGIITGRTTCSTRRRTARAHQMTGSADSGKCRTELRASSGQSLVPADRNVCGRGIHQLLQKERSSMFWSDRPVPADRAPSLSWPVRVLGPAVVQWTVPSCGELGRLLRANRTPFVVLVIADCRGYR